MRFAPLVLAVVMVACSSTAEPSLRQLSEPSTPSVGRELAVPTPGRAASGPPPRDSRAVHVLGAFEQLPTDAMWVDRLPAFDNDVATIATIACELGSDGCTLDLLGNLAAGGIDVVNLSSSSVQDAAEAQSALSAVGLDVVGLTEGDAVSLGGGPQVTVHAINLRDPTTEVATAEQAVADGPEATAATIALVLWVDETTRAPSVEKVSIVEGLVDAGADAVIGSGSVYLQRAERVDDALVAYNLGHAATLRDDPLERDTAILRLVIDSPTESSCLLPATAGPDGPVLDNPSALWCG